LLVLLIFLVKSRRCASPGTSSCERCALPTELTAHSKGINVIKLNLKNLTLLKVFFYSFADYAQEKVTYKLRLDYARISWTRYD
jgi:hypothetical protein